MPQNLEFFFSWWLARHPSLYGVQSKLKEHGRHGSMTGSHGMSERYMKTDPWMVEFLWDQWIDQYTIVRWGLMGWEESINFLFHSLQRLQIVQLQNFLRTFCKEKEGSEEMSCRKCQQILKAIERQLASCCRNHALGVYHSAEWSWEWSEVWILILQCCLLIRQKFFDISNPSNWLQLFYSIPSIRPPFLKLAQHGTACSDTPILLLFVDSARAHLRSAAFSSSDKFLASCSRAHLTNSFQDVSNTIFFTFQLHDFWNFQVINFKCT